MGPDSRRGRTIIDYYLEIILWAGIRLSQCMFAYTNQESTQKLNRVEFLDGLLFEHDPIVITFYISALNKAQSCERSASVSCIGL